jgi:hypothetical protein
MRKEPPMKSMIGLTLALALVLSVAPVMAAESFEGMESLNSPVAALPDADLAKVEGQGSDVVQICVDCTNVAEVEQEVEITQVIRGCCDGKHDFKHDGKHDGKGNGCCGGVTIQSAQVEVESEIIQGNNLAFVRF